jgi:hypothetical protein
MPIRSEAGQECSERSETRSSNRDPANLPRAGSVLRDEEMVPHSSESRRRSDKEPTWQEVANYHFAISTWDGNRVNCWKPEKVISSQANQGWLEGSQTRSSSRGPANDPRARGAATAAMR